MENVAREPSTKTVYVMNPGHGTAQPSTVSPGNVVCLPLSGAGGSFAGRSRKTVYRMAPSQIQGTRVLQPVINGGAGTKIVSGAKCDACPPNTRVQAYTLEGDRLSPAPEPSIVRVVPQGKRIYLEEVQPCLPRSVVRPRQKMPTVMQLADDGNWYANLPPESETEVEVAPAGMDPDACVECLEELRRRRRSPAPEPRAKEPIYVTTVPSSKRSCSRRAPASPPRSPPRSPQPPQTLRCVNCTACKSCGTVTSATTSRSKSRKWYE